MTRGLRLRAWARGMRARFGRGVRAPFGAKMTLQARRAPSCTILRPVSIHLRWAWNAAAAAAPVLPHANPGMILRERERERMVPGIAAAMSPGDRAAAAPARRESREYFTMRLHTAVRSREAYHAMLREQAVRRRIELLHVAQTTRRELVVEPVRQLAPLLRQVYARREQMHPAPAARLRATPAPEPKAAAQPASAPQTRIAERIAPAPAAQTAPNIDWIASQVVEQIDRRLVAYRERMGRI